MKKFLLFTTASAFSLLSLTACGQKGDKSKRPSPPALAKQTLASGVTVSIDYSQPSIKGRTIGKDVEPMAGKVWRTGANEATVFEVDKDVKIEGQSLPKGKYSLYSISGDEWTIIFNKTWDQWGTNYNEKDDALRVKVKPGKAASFAEKMNFTISKEGKVSLTWGDIQVDFNVQ
ncbi:MAG: lipoprotein [Sphingobacteriales bacterium]